MNLTDDNQKITSQRNRSVGLVGATTMVLGSVIGMGNLCSDIESWSGSEGQLGCHLYDLW